MRRTLAAFDDFETRKRDSRNLIFFASMFFMVLKIYHANDFAWNYYHFFYYFAGYFNHFSGIHLFIGAVTTSANVRVLF